MHLEKDCELVTIYQSLPKLSSTQTSERRLVQKAKQYLQFFSKLTEDKSFDTFSINVVYGGSMSGFPAQDDASSCGVFSIVVLYHILAGATLALKISQLREWRNYVAVKTKEVLHA